MKNLYNEDYYEKGIETGVSCYSNYRWMPELTIPMCATLIEILGIKESDKILDYGCAKGYVVKAFRLLHREAYGVDVSQYAISTSPEDVREYLYLNEIKDQYDWIVAKDVLEHINYDKLDNTLRKLRSACKYMFCIVPLGENGRYVVPAYELDSTHKIRESLEWWEQRFRDTGFTIKQSSYKMKHIKDNYSKWEKGNGFFILH